MRLAAAEVTNLHINTMTTHVISYYWSTLCLLDLSAAFDTIDHNIGYCSLVSSWFGIQGSALDWFKSYYHLAHLLRLNSTVITTFLPVIIV